MSFLNPAGLLLLLAIPPVVLLYLLKFRRRDAVVGSLMFWEPSLRDQQVNSLWQRLQANPLLLLQVVVLTAAALALARPYLALQRAGYPRVIVLLDPSATMRATDLVPSRFEAARAEGLALIRQLGAGQTMMLLEAGAVPRIVVPFTADERALRRGLESLEARDVPRNLAEAIRFAQAQGAARGPGGTALPSQVHVLTDAAFPPLKIPDVPGVDIAYHALARGGGNVGITAMEVRKTHFGGFEYQLFLALGNFGDEPREFQLRVSVDKEPLSVQRVALGPKVRRSLIIPFSHQAGGLLRAELDLQDDLAADNAAMAVLPAPRKLRALLVTAGNLFLQKALAADPLVDARIEDPQQFKGPAGADVVVLDNFAPEKLPAGRYLIVNAVPKNLPLEVRGRVDAPPVVDWDRGHPAMRYLDLTKVGIEEALWLRPLGTGRTLVESNLTPLVYALEEGDIRAIVVGFDLFKADLPLRVAFPLFVTNALRWLSPSRLEDASLQVKAGQPATVPVPPGVTAVEVTDPAGARSKAAAEGGRVTVVGTGRVGLYTLRAGEWEGRFAVNLLDEGLSDIAPRADAFPVKVPGPPPTFQVRHELWLALAALALVLLLVEGAVYHRQVLGRWAWGALPLRLAVLGLLVATLLRPTLTRPTERMNVLFLWDRSDSISLDNALKAERYIREATRAMGKDDTAGIIAFAGEAQVEVWPEKGLRPGKLLLDRPSQSGATDLGRAIRLGLAAMPREGGRRLVLLTDGNENRGGALDAARLARSEGAEIYAVPLASAAGGEVLLERAILPQEVKQGESFLLRIVAWSAKETEGRLSLYRDGAFVGSQQVKLQPGKNVFAYQQSVDGAGVHVYQASLEAPEDAVEENNRAVGVLAVRGRPKVLYAEKDLSQARHLIAALKPQGIEVDLVPPEGIPATLAALQKYDSVIISNISSLRMAKPQMELIRSYVRDHGGGLLMLGGEESFGVGGYYHTPIEEALPVTMETRQKIEIPSLATVLVLDRSGSMEISAGRVTKLDLAKEAAQLVVDLLDERNEVGVIAFDTVWSWVVPMGPARNKDAIHKAIASIKAGGGTDMFPAMKEAYQVLYDRRAILKHMILLTDGQVQAADFPGLVRRMVKDKVTVSGVAIGSDADVQLMVDISRWGRGRSYFTEDIYSVPRIFTLETQLAAKASIVEQPFKPVLGLGSHEILQDINWEGVPPLGGYVATTLKQKADLLLASHQRDPILAAWRYGLGRTVAFTSDAKARWGILWLRWEEFNRFVAQMVRWTLRTASRGEITTAVQYRDGRGVVTVEAVDQKGEFINFLDTQVGVVYPDQRRAVLELTQVGPGRYQGGFEAGDQGAYLVGVAQRRDNKTVGSEIGSLVVPYSIEHRALAANESLLRQVVAATGGGLLTGPSQAFGHNRQGGLRLVDLWPWLLAAAALVFVADVAARRLPLRQALRERWRRSGRGAGPGAAAPGAGPGPELELRVVRGRVRR
jgi:uncharacterized membrane protein